MPIVGQFGSLAGLGSMILPGGAFESIATVTVGSGGAANIAFTSIPGTYQHLQVRMVTCMPTAGNGVVMRFNSDNGSGKYKSHTLYGNGSSAAAGVAGLSTGGFAGWFGGGAAATAPGAAVVDILDYANTSKNTTVRTFDGYDANGSGYVGIDSFLWIDTAAVTSITLTDGGGGNLQQHMTAALFGVRA